jgi:RNA polymerase sigma-70 factor, ECF subfamily
VVQEAYLLAYRSIQDFRGEAKLSTWLIRIVVNLAIRRKKRQSRHDAMFTDSPDASDEEAQDMGESDPRTPETEASNAELRRLLEAHIDRLPDMYREVLVLRGIEELSVEETAEVLGIPEATIRTRFFRARHILREGLAKDIDIALGDAFSFAGDRCDRIVAGVLDRLKSRVI